MLERETFLEVVRNSPLVSIDLIVRNRAGEILLGLRNNAPARDCWFVPGGRICKNERLTDGLARVAREELCLEITPQDARLIGVFEHLYEDNFAGAPGFGTHYIVLAHAIELPAGSAAELPQQQHRSYRWIGEAALLADPAVHEYTKRYFDESLGR